MNVPSYRRASGVTVHVPGYGPVQGDVAWGGNWFFLVAQHGLALSIENIPQLTDVAWRMRQAVNAAGYPEMDHIELFGPPVTPAADSRNFVLVSGPGVRSVSLRNGHQRQTRVPGGGRETRRRGDVGAGEYYWQHV